MENSKQERFCCDCKWSILIPDPGNPICSNPKTNDIDWIWGTRANQSCRILRSGLILPCGPHGEFFRREKTEEIWRKLTEVEATLKPQKPKHPKKLYLERMLLKLAEEPGCFAYDPYSWLLYSFPWEEGELKDCFPYPWQEKFLRSLGDDLLAGRRGNKPIMKAVSKGCGVGATALSAWLALWAVATFANTRVVITANTEKLLFQKTWGELKKWFDLCWYSEELFRFNQTSLVSKDEPQTWRIDAIPPLEYALFNLFNKGKRVLYLFDECSAIGSDIWDACENNLADPDTERMWLVLGAPTHSRGRFKECFDPGSGWDCTQIDSRTCTGVNQDVIVQWAKDYGEDSDFFKTKVCGVFPE